MKKLFGIMALVAIAAAASWNFSQSQNEVELSDLALANVEALASYEFGDGYCHYSNNYDWCFYYISGTVCYGVDSHCNWL